MSINIVKYLELLKKDDVVSYNETITILTEYLQKVEERNLSKKYIEYLDKNIKNVYINKIKNIDINICYLDTEQLSSIIGDNIKNIIKSIEYEANENERWPECDVYTLKIYGENDNKRIIDKDREICINNDVFSNLMSSYDFTIENMHSYKEFDNYITNIFKQDLGYNETLDSILTYTLNCMFITLLGEITYNNKIFK